MQNTFKFEQMENGHHSSLVPQRKVDEKKNINMNKTAVLFDKLDQTKGDEIPKYVVSKLITSSLGSKKDTNKDKEQKNPLRETVKKTLLMILEKSASELTQNLEEESSIKKVKKALSENRKPFPIEILNILYRQNIPGYNPFLVSLKKLDELETMNHDIKERIEKLCYIGIAKNQLRNVSSDNFLKYSRVGILIRPYMNQVMSTKLAELKFEEPQTTYLKIGLTALSFNPKKMPSQLQSSISRKKFSQIIQGVNKIIHTEYKKHKTSNFNKLSNSITYSEIIMYVVVTLMVLIFMIWTPSEDSPSQYGFIAGVTGAICIGSCMAWKESNNRVKKVSSSTGITDKIQKKIKSYLESVSNDALIWKPGPDFYWLEVTNIKVKKRKYQQNNDDF